MSQKVSNLFALPFVRSFSTGPKRFITLLKVQTFLGNNFYPRLNTIYGNLVEAIAKRNYQYIQAYVEPQLSQKIREEMLAIDEGKFRVKVVSPIKMPKKQSKNIFALRERIWDNGITRIGLQCNVIFGEKFDLKDPLKLNEYKESKIYRVGQFRYIRYYPHLSLMENLKNMYNEQTYELMIKYSSKMYIHIGQPLETGGYKPTSSDENEIMTEIKMRTGNEKFEWIIVDINDLRKEFRI